MKIPDDVLKIVHDAAAKHSDIKKAFQQAKRAMLKLPTFEEVTTTLIDAAIMEWVYDARHKLNVQMRQNSSCYGGSAKVAAGSSRSVQAVHESLYSYRIAGTVLGLVLGKDLGQIAESERAVGKGHLFNSRLVGRLMPLVPAEKRVQEVVSEKQLRTFFVSVQEIMTKLAG